jgi:hypothetical protein
MATISCKPAGGLQTPPPGSRVQLAATFYPAGPDSKPEDCTGRSKRSIERLTQSITRSPLGPSGCSRHGDYCWKVTSPSISAVALSIF